MSSKDFYEIIKFTNFLCKKFDNLSMEKKEDRTNESNSCNNQSNLWLLCMNVWTTVKMSTLCVSVKFSFPV